MPVMKSAHASAVCVKLTPAFKRDLEKATRAAGLPSVSEFVRQAIIEMAAKHGVKIDRYR